MKAIVFAIVLLPAMVQAQVVDVGRMTPELTAIPAPWKRVQLSEKIPPTQYQLREWEGVMAIEATANASMALLARPLEIDLKQTPMLCWRWRVDAPLIHADMLRKSGDDFAARVYVAFSLPKEAMSHSHRLKLGVARQWFGAAVPDAAINYVWDNSHPVGFEAPNAYTEYTRMIVLESGTQRMARWVEVRRDVAADARRVFNTDQFTATLLAVASDTDNTGETAHAGFADLHWVGTAQPCSFSKSVALKKP